MLKKWVRNLYAHWVEGAPPAVDSKLTGTLLRKCLGKPEPVILDIGSNDGSHALWFRELFEQPKIHCFEPDPRAIERFEKKVGDTDGIFLYKIALSDHDGEIEFHQSTGERVSPNGQVLTRDWDLSGSIRKPKNHLKVHPWVKFEKTIQVNTKTLDTWCFEQNVSAIDFIWMDVQGAEVDVLRGGRDILAKTSFIYTEYNNEELYEGQPTLKAILENLQDFRVLVRYPNDVLLAHKRLNQTFPFCETVSVAGSNQ